MSGHPFNWADSSSLLFQEIIGSLLFGAYELLDFHLINLEFELAGFLCVRENNSEQIVSVGVELRKGK